MTLCERIKCIVYNKFTFAGYISNIAGISSFMFYENRPFEICSLTIGTLLIAGTGNAIGTYYAYQSSKEILKKNILKKNRLQAIYSSQGYCAHKGYCLAIHEHEKINNKG
jgi:hypothetical protein